MHDMIHSNPSPAHRTPASTSCMPYILNLSPVRWKGSHTPRTLSLMLVTIFLPARLLFFIFSPLSVFNNCTLFIISAGVMLRTQIAFSRPFT